MSTTSEQGSSGSTVTRQHKPADKGNAEVSSSKKGIAMKKPGDPFAGFAAGMSVQPKLKMGASNDRYEREADTIADKVTGTGNGEKRAQAAPLASTVTPLVQRQEGEKEEEAQAKGDDEKEEQAQAKGDDDKEEAQAKGEDEEEAQAMALPAKPEEKKKEEEKDRPKVMRKPASAGPRAIRSDIASRIKSARGKGDKLPDETKEFMESRFGTDFSNVNIHTDKNAADLSVSLNAKAFTVGGDVFFNQGRFDPSSTEGKKLIAHELTHTIQQGAVEAKPKEQPAQKTEKKDEKLASAPAQQAKIEQPPKPESKPSAEKTSAPAKDPTEATQKALPKTEDAKALDKSSAEQSAATEKAASQNTPAGDVTKTPAEGSDEAPAKELPGKEGPAKETPEKASGKEEPAGKEPGKKDAAKEEKAPGKQKKEESGKAAAKKEGGGGSVSAYLKTKGAPAMKKGRSGIVALSKNMQKHDDAATKTAQAVKAVEPPVMEGDSKGKAQQVETVEKAAPPKPDEQKAKKTLTDTVEQNVPKSLKEVDNFKKSGKGKVAGNAVLGDVKAQTDSVQSSYTGISDAKPVPSTETPEALPEPEKTEAPGKLGLGEGTVPALKPEHTDLTEYSEQSDKLVEKENITEEQLEMVDEGELAEAKKVKSDVKEKTKSEPEAVRTFAAAESKDVTQKLAKEEQTEKTQMLSKRKNALNDTKKKQQGTKTGIEKKREEVALKINGIYQRAKDKVTNKLNDLEKSSLKRFDDGQAQASAKFEESVKRDIDAYKGKRYSGTFGWAKKAKDWLMGMEDHKEVKEAFDKARTEFVNTIQALVDNITADNKKVIQECKDELAAAKKEIDDYVKKLGPELKEAGQTAMKEMNAKLAELDTMVAKKEKELEAKLKEKQEAAIKAIDEKIAKMKEAMSGAISILGKLLLEAAKKFFRWALGKIGAPVDKIMGILEKGAMVLKEIVTGPVKFIGNLVKGVKGGIGQFSGNIQKHLINGIMGWLVGPLAEGGVTLPKTFDLKGAFGLVMQVLGLTYQNIRKMIAKRVGDPLVAKIEQGVDIAQKLVKEGPVALWEHAKESLGDIKETILSEIRNWVAIQIVKEAVMQLISYLNPAGAIFQAIKAIYNIVMFFIERWEQIVEFVGAVFDSIAEIAMGNIGKASSAVENALAKSLPVIISFLARLIGLGGVGKKVREIFDKLRKPIEKVLAKVVDFIVKKGKAFIAKVGGGVTKLKEKGKEKIKQLVEWWKVKTIFKVKNKNHSLFFKGSGKSAKLTVASTPKDIQTWLSDRKKTIPAADEKGKEKLEAINYIEQTLLPQLNKITNAPDNSAKKKDTAKLVKALLADLQNMIKVIGFDDKHPVPKMLVNPGFSNKMTEGTMQVRYLYKNTKDEEPNHEPGTGTGKQDLFGAFTEIKRLGLSPFWSRGHLLNKDFGGKGIESNLIPIHQSINRFQAPYDAQVTKLYDERKVLWLDFIVERKHPEKMFVSRYTVKGGAMKFKDGIWVKGNEPIPAHFSEPVPKPEHNAQISLKNLASAPSSQYRDIGRANNISASFILTMAKSGKSFTKPEDIREFMIERFEQGHLSEVKKKKYLNRLEDAIRTNRLKFD